ncbi:hypothetical protein [Tropicibacter naphthalenivorans]|uniref:Uncharacterized protein n=1 Tax=Tropicibacter naphthalenivorans TaxID=441103 RepID=A0A0P1GRW7_9RHOB|nr:hypothetical protein [Tropicibacter naphthalenivorans]CUH78248.1 hypothetical protein TRN7648_01875 [Tropicibacter naphthalenivorans]SMC78659.1 hypothetical protein SAMN04488093_10437 [Tropicibacter naphthalenivorans]
MQDLADHVTSLIEAEISAHDASARAGRMLLDDFQRLRVKRPRQITVNFSGGITQKCWTVTRSNGDYSTVYLPTAGYFSLCVDSDFGPLDIGVHGPALRVFSAV